MIRKRKTEYKASKSGIINIGTLSDLGSIESDKNDKSLLYKIKERNEELRKNVFHVVTHLLAFIIIAPWVYLQLKGLPVTQIYSTITSVVIGFYFGKTLFKYS